MSHFGYEYLFAEPNPFLRLYVDDCWGLTESHSTAQSWRKTFQR